MDEITGAEALVRANGRSQGHDRCGTGIRQVTGSVEIGVHVRQDDEAFLGEDFCGLNGFCIIRQEVFRIAHDFDLYEITAADFPGQAGNADGFVGITGA